MITGFRFLARSVALLGALTVGACGSDDPVTPTPDTSAPTGLAGTAAGATTIDLSWTAASSATGYVLQRATGAVGAWAEIATPAASATNYADANLQTATTYRYRIAAVRSSGTSVFSAPITVTTGATPIVDVTINITTNTTWTADKVWRLKGFRKVANGATLTIEAGTTIIGDYATLGSSLFVLRGARIVAIGTAEQPIVFTSSQPVGQRQPGDWGGLIIVGNGIINRVGNVQIEGTGTSADNEALLYSGGTNNADNSGTLRYVRVEYAGFGPATNEELNSFTFAAVGSGTTLEYLQALNGLDDHYEWFGGAVDASYLVSYQSGDDHYDMSEGYVGRLRHLIAYQRSQLVPRPGAGNASTDPQGIENDGCNGTGCTAGHDQSPFTVPVVANFTLVGTGPGAVGVGGGYGMMLRRGTGGHYVNGVVARWPSAAIAYRDAGTKARETAGLLSFKGLFVAQSPVLFEAGQQTYGGPAGDIEYQAATTAASLFVNLPAVPTSGADFDWTPAVGAPVRTGGTTTFTGDLLTRAGGVVSPTSYRGAVDPVGAKWWQGWTTYSDN